MPNPDFWRARWSTQQIAFHQAAPTRFLVEHRARAAGEPGSSVFVPLCGKTKDLAYLASVGHRVTGSELMEDALEAFFAENSLEHTQRREGDFEIFEGGPITAYGGDFFRLSPAITGAMDWIFDRAALVSFSQEEQPRYVEHLAKFLRPGGRILLVSLYYDDTAMSGPPFSLPAERLKELFGRAFDLELLDERDALEDRFRARGLTWLKEQVWVLSGLASTISTK